MDSPLKIGDKLARCHGGSLLHRSHCFGNGQPDQDIKDSLRVHGLFFFLIKKLNNNKMTMCLCGNMCTWVLVPHHLEDKDNFYLLPLCLRFPCTWHSVESTQEGGAWFFQGTAEMLIWSPKQLWETELSITQFYCLGNGQPDQDIKNSLRGHGHFFFN